MPRQPIGVDPACYTLADHFLVEKVTADCGDASEGRGGS